MTTAQTPQEVRFYLDPICPWAYRTSLWIREAAKVRPLQLCWGFLTLDGINRAAGNPPKESHQRSFKPLRVMALARRSGGDDAVDRLYAAFGRAAHERGQDIGETAVIEAVLEEAGFDRGLLEAALADPSTEQELQEEHAAIVAAGGLGVPMLVVDGAAPLFGPVIDAVPTGEAAGELWDHVLWTLRQPHFLELKRARQ